jgi:small subunit ribosomal protein S17
MNERANPRTRVGIVRSNKMDKTAVVEVVRYVRHPLYKKYIRRLVKYLAHDAENSCGIGDEVRIIETRPMSRRKRWRVLETLRAVQ